MYGYKNRRGKLNNGIMANTGFGDLVIVKQGLKITIPAKSVKRKGSLNKKVESMLRVLSTENAVILNQKYGVTVEIEQNNMVANQ